MALAMLMPVAVPAASKGTNSAIDTPGTFISTVIGNAPDRTEDVAPVRALLDAINAGHPASVAHLGSLRDRDEACSDTLFETCRDLPDSLIAPVICTPDDHDWSNCQRLTAGSFNPVRRLLRLHELFYLSDSALG